MAESLNRRVFVTTAALGAAAGLAPTLHAQNPQAADRRVRILGISCSPRGGRTTAQALQAALEAAREVDPAVEVELIDLGGMNIPIFVPGSPDHGDFDALIPRLTDPRLGGIIIGSPVYFCSPSSLCKAFLDHCSAFRANSFAWRNKVGAALAVGAARNGGQELTLQCIQAALMCQEMVIVGDGQPTARIGATLVNPGDDRIAGDALGLATARNLGRRVAQTALALRG